MDPEFEPTRQRYQESETIEQPAADPDALTLAQILPGVPARTRKRFASTLKLTGLIVSRGKGHEYGPEAVEVLRDFARLVRQEHLTIHDALESMRDAGRGVVVANKAKSVIKIIASAVIGAGVTPDSRASVETPGHPASCGSTGSAVAVLNVESPDDREQDHPAVHVDKPSELENLRAAKDAADLREAVFIAEMSRLKGAIERFRLETAELRKESQETIRDLDEERRNARVRIARLEALAKTKPRGMWGRVKAAFGVLLGRAAAIPALPAPREIFEVSRQDLQKAA